MDLATQIQWATGDRALNEALGRLHPMVEAACRDADSAHDFLHVVRVTRTALQLTREERGNPWVSVTSAWLHELFNYPKGHPESRNSGIVCAEHATKLLTAQNWDPSIVTQVAEAIADHPFSLGKTPATLEGKILQDADRLDAIGAIGIARCFATCAAMKRPFYSIDDPMADYRPLDDKSYGLDHFGAKLLKLAGSMHTASARKIANERNQFMHDFINQLESEIA